jgi:hypothetical protein
MGPRAFTRGGTIKVLKKKNANPFFNGAARFHTRRGIPLLCFRVKHELLQWGRALSHAEGVFLLLVEP